MTSHTARPPCILAAALLLTLPVGGLLAQGAPDAADQAAPVWSPYAAWTGRQIYLGPTGARGWVGQGRIIVTQVPAGSPAEGRLRVNDVLIEAGGKALADDEDPRRVVGDAITAAETDTGAGKLTLTVDRAGKRTPVTVPLRAMGSYSPTWPQDCPKSAKVLQEACDYLAREQFPDGHVEGEGVMATAWAALLWLAADDGRYLDNARRAVYFLSRADYATHELRCWALGYGGMAMAEYFLATGDAGVLPKLQEMARFTAAGQMACGTWGHNIPWDGYGALNQAGLVCWIMLMLAQECGLEVDQAAIDRSTRFFGRYVGRGGIAYGDHIPTRGDGSNGKDALGAVGFFLRGKPEGWRFLAKLVAAAYRYRERGHTGCFLSLYWGPVAASMAGEAKFRRFMDYQRWYYDLARVPDGGLVCQPNPENLSGRTEGVYTYNGPRFTTGGMAMVFAIPRRAVRVLGAEPSVFGRALDGPLAEARRLYEQRDWTRLNQAVAKLSRDGASAERKRWAAQLAKAADRQRLSVERTLKTFDQLIAAGDAYRASELLAGLRRLLGPDANELADAAETMEAHSRWVDTGRQYYDAWAKLQAFTWQSWHYYGQKLLEVPGPFVPPPAIRAWLPVAPTSLDQPQTWRIRQGAENQAPPEGWTRVAFDDSQWTATKGPIRSGGRGAAWTQPVALLRRTIPLPQSDLTDLRLLVAVANDMRAVIYLNGQAILRVEPGAFRGYAEVNLPPDAARLLVRGANVLAVRAERGPRGGTLDVGIEGLARRP